MSDYEDNAAAAHNGASAETNRKRPLLYESKGRGTRRRRTDTDIQLPKSLLTADQDIPTENTNEDVLRSSTERHNSMESSLEQKSTFTRRRDNRRKFAGNDKLRRQTVAVDGIYYARRVMSIEELPLSTSGDVEKGAVKSGAEDVATDSDDEFFLATDFVTPLPKSKYTQSVDYLDNIIREDTYSHHDIQRRYAACFGK